MSQERSKMRRNRRTGQEAPMVITPRGVVRLLRQIYSSLRRRPFRGEA
jgi:hypothetical protein